MDKRAKKILFQTYWKNGWIDRAKRSISQEDFLYAKEKGLMFDLLTISHDECIAKITTLATEISQDKITRAFIASLSTRRLDWRSGLASWFIAKQLPPHMYTPVVSGTSYDKSGAYTHKNYTCSVCKDLKYGVNGSEHYQDTDLNVLNFERIKWGGVRHGQLIYTMFDLEQFQKEDIPEPNNDDINIFRNILQLIESSNPKDHPGKLRDRMSDLTELKSNKGELSTLIEILACIGVLKPTDYSRTISNIRHDWKFVEHWRGEDKYNKEVVQNLFGQYTV